MKKLNLGAGDLPLAWHINVDITPLPGIDVVHDLDVVPWPWEDSSIDEIQGFDIFEHVDKPLEFMNECARVLKSGGVLNLHTNYWKSENAYTDPTHKRFCTERTFDYWIKDTEFNVRYGKAYTRDGGEFEKIYIRLDGTELVVRLRRL